MNRPAWWEKQELKAYAFWPLSLLYRVGAWLDRETSKPQSAPIPVLSLGNATVGGTGKTPSAIALIPYLTELGFTPHILTRGYQSATVLHAHRVTETDTAADVGDEALLLAPAAPTWVGRDRVASAFAASRQGATLALCDDAHQHYRLRKTLSLLVIDGPYGFGNGFLLPAGPLREPLHHAFARTDAVILIGDDPHGLATKIKLPVFRAQFAPSIAMEPLTQNRYLAFAGIGRPEKFFTTLRDHGVRLVGTRSFPDHHRYSDAEIEVLLTEATAQGAQLITTEKDAVKLSPAHRAQVQTLPVTLRFDAPDALRDFLRHRLT